MSDTAAGPASATSAPPDVLPPSAPSRAQVPPAELPGLNGLLTLAVGVVTVAGLYLAREVLIPITLAVLLSFALAPLMHLFRRIGLGRVPSALLAVVLALGVILGLGSLIGTQVASLATDLPRYQYTIERKVQSLRSLTLGHMGEIVGRLGKQIERASAPPAGTQAAPASPGSSQPEEKPVPVIVQEAQPAPLVLAERILAPVVGPLETTFIVVVVAIFVLLQREDLRDRLIRLFGSGDLHRTTVALDDAAQRLSRYFLTQLALNASFGVVIGAGLFLIGVPSPALWGLLAALLRFVPYLGVPIAALVPIVLAAAVDPGWSMMIWTLGLFVVIEGVTGQAIEPLLYGHSTGLSPVSVVVAAIFWTWLWGPIGLILSTPLTLCVVVLGRHVERLEFLDVLLGDRPALTPIENFYQRILAGDADEAEENAEVLLKDRPLSAYYDEVALKGLRLAAHDARRGALTEEQLARVAATIREVIEDLADHHDQQVPPEPKAEAKAETDTTVLPLSPAERAVPRTPPPQGMAPPQESLPPAWRGEAPVLCIAGGGPLDEAAAEMLAQLLRKHGLGARVVGREAVARANIARLDLRGVAMICLSYVEIAGTPSRLRFVLRRLRARTGGVPILVGLWPADDPVLQDAAARAAISADYYVTSLREAVESCLKAAREAAEPPAPAQARSA